MYAQIVRHGEGTLHYYSYSRLYTASVYTHATLNLTNFIKKNLTLIILWCKYHFDF